VDEFAAMGGNPWIHAHSWGVCYAVHFHENAHKDPKVCSEWRGFWGNHVPVTSKEWLIIFLSDPRMEIFLSILIVMLIWAITWTYYYDRRAK
jgi:hypothetical protein